MRRARKFAVFALLASAAFAATEALAQRYGGSDQGYSRYGRNQRTYQAGVFDYYLLSLSWSPSYCASRQSGGYDPQCDRRGGRPYSFVLHGLWPQFEKGWPQDCASPDRGFVPREVADRMLDIMPSQKLVFHEYRKHGTCSGLGIEGYFDFARQEYNKVKIPARYQQVTDDRMFVSPAEVVQDFVAANPGLRANMMAVSCSGPGDRMQEVRICVDKAGDFRACGRNENQRKLCSAPRMYVPPVRASATGGGTDSRSPEQKSL